MNNGIGTMKDLSTCKPIFSGKLVYSHKYDVKSSVPVYDIFSQRLFPLQEPGVNYEASTLTKEEITVNL